MSSENSEIPIDNNNVPSIIAKIRQVSLEYGNKKVLDSINLDIPAGCMVAVIGPDGVGKSSLLSLLAGTKIIQTGKIELFGEDLSNSRYRQKICPKIAYMPQGLGKNLYPTLSVYENVDFFARLFGIGSKERISIINTLLKTTGLLPFANRPVGKLSGGMKQKLGLCCALIHNPDILILDEPTTGVDPLSRRLFWDLIKQIRLANRTISIVVASAYMEEASHFDWIIAMNFGRILYTGTTKELMQKTSSSTMEEAFIALLPPSQKEHYKPVIITPKIKNIAAETAIEAHNLTMRFNNFTAVDHVNFRIERGEIFGFLGSNGCGKTTTMKILTGLLKPSEGESFLFGRKLNPHDLETRKRIGYMSQSFSLYTELSVEQNLILHAHLFKLPTKEIPERIKTLSIRFGLEDVMDKLPNSLPLGQRQRLSLAVAMIHRPEILILDEPTSGVDPIARDSFWQIMLDLAHKEHVTIFISTHFMNEAERCDRISLMHAGKVLDSDAPSELIKKRKTENLEEAFISYLKDIPSVSSTEESIAETALPNLSNDIQDKLPYKSNNKSFFSLRRLISYTRREIIELCRDPIRMSLAILGSIILMIAFGYGISFDIENLSFAILDRDQTSLSRDYTLNLAGSRYFKEKPPLKNYDELDQRMKSGEISLAIEIPSDFARNISHGRPVSIGAWTDGAMPRRAEIIHGYVQGMHAQWLAHIARQKQLSVFPPGKISIEPRFRYNLEVKSIPAIVPAVIPLLLMLIPAILSAIAVVREKELGSIINFYVTPITRLEFLISKQIPYIILAFFSFLFMTAISIFLFKVPVKGSFLTLSTATVLYVTCAASLGLVISSFTKSQIAALFGTSILTLLPAIQFSGMLNPITSLQGVGEFIGWIYPTTHYLTISRGTFSKSLDFEDLQRWFLPLLLAIPILLGLGIAFLKKQER